MSLWDGLYEIELGNMASSEAGNTGNEMQQYTAGDAGHAGLHNDGHMASISSSSELEVRELYIIW